MSEQTPITIGLLLAIMTMGLPVLWIAFKTYTKVKWLCDRENGKWTVAQQRLWAERLSHSNPAINVPNVDDVVNTFADKTKQRTV